MNQESKKQARTPRTMGQRHVMLLCSIFVIVALSLALPFTGLLFTDSAHAQNQTSEQGISDAQKGFGSDVNPRSNYWRAIREGNGGTTQVKGTDSNVLINPNGQNWRAVRNGPVSYWGWIVMAAMAVAILLFALLKGRVKVEGGMSGVKVKRWSGFNRFLHWVTAITFILLSATGLSLFYGKTVLIPVLGKDAFSTWALFAKNIHNYAGPVFAASLIILLLMLLSKNIPNGSDIKWFLKGGGLIGKGHPSAGFANGGEKVWYWLLATFGMAVVLTGLAINFLVDLTRDQSMLALGIHAIASFIVMAVALGHIYIGTLGTEGSLEGMTSGEVDLNWAQQHHDEWVADLQKDGQLTASGKAGREPPMGATAAVGD